MGFEYIGSSFELATGQLSRWPLAQCQDGGPKDWPKCLIKSKFSQFICYQLFYDVHLIMVDCIFVLTLKSEICSIKKCRADVLFSNKYIILLHTSKQISFSKFTLHTKSLEQEKPKLSCTNWRNLSGSVQGLSKILRELILPSKKSLGG